MKTCVTIGEFLENNPDGLKEGRQIWAEDERGNFKDRGQLVEIMGYEAKINHIYANGDRNIVVVVGKYEAIMYYNESDLSPLNNKDNGK